MLQVYIFELLNQNSRVCGLRLNNFLTANIAAEKLKKKGKREEEGQKQLAD